MIAMPWSIVVFICMGVAWWYDRRSLIADRVKMKALACDLLYELKRMREQH